MIITCVTGGCLAAQLPWRLDNHQSILQVIRANPNFYKRPCFDNVEVRRHSANGCTQPAYAQLRLLFQCNLAPAAGAPSVLTPLAFVQWYKLAPARGGSDPLQAAGCLRVCIDDEGRHDVIPLSAIVCRHMVVPSFASKGHFYVSCFAPTRSV